MNIQYKKPLKLSFFKNIWSCSTWINTCWTKGDHTYGVAFFIAFKTCANWTRAWNRQGYRGYWREGLPSGVETMMKYLFFEGGNSSNDFSRPSKAGEETGWFLPPLKKGNTSDRFPPYPIKKYCQVNCINFVLDII